MLVLFNSGSVCGVGHEKPCGAVPNVSHAAFSVVVPGFTNPTVLLGEHTWSAALVVGEVIAPRISSKVRNETEVAVVLGPVFGNAPDAGVAPPMMAYSIPFRCEAIRLSRNTK